MVMLLIDGDVLCYMACKARWEPKVQKDENGNSIIKLDENGKRIPLEYTKEEDTKYLRESLDNVRKDFYALLDKFYTNDFLMAVKGEGNFRELLYPEYKQNRHRDPDKQNAFVPVLRKLLVHEDLALEATGREADDLLRIWANECIANGIDYIVVSIDKDLKCIPGRHYNLKKETEEDVSEEEAMRHYYEQLLKGDPTDNIPGIPRMGPVKAAKALKDCKTEIEFQDVVIEQYMIAYDDQWKEALLFNGKMIHLQNNINDYFGVSEWPLVKEFNL